MKVVIKLLACLYFITFAYTGYAYYPENNIVKPALKTEQVFYNTNSHIYHNLSCRWARACTKNCILIDKSEAMNRGRACKVCGG